MLYRMPINEVLKLKSRDGSLKATVEQVIGWKDIDNFLYTMIRREMEKSGINLVPVLVKDDIFYNGHHRVMIALELGHDEIMVTDNDYDLMDYDDYTVVKYEGKVPV